MVNLARSRRLLGRAAVAALSIGVVLSISGVAQAIGVPLTTVSTDPYVNPTSIHQSELEPDTFSFGSTIVSVFQTGRFFDGGSSNIGFATSTDNGATWTNGFMPGTTVYATPAGIYDRISDPSVAYDAEHDVWMATGLAITGTTGKAVIVNRSTDGGLTWTNPVTVSIGGGFSFYDKEWITCDSWASSPNFGNCYIEWDDANLGNVLKMSRSTDGGLTWTASSVPSAAVIGGNPLAQPDGTVVVPISDAFGSVAETFISTNGGSSYTGPFTISSISVHFVAGGLRDGGGLISAEVDAAGKIYVAWHDCRFRSNCHANDIVMTTSTDGKVWTAVTRVPIDSVGSKFDHFIPGIGVDRTTSGATARVGITFYEYPKANCTSTTCKMIAAFISSPDGGATWSPPTILFSGPINLSWIANTNQGRMVGDYISTSWGSNGKAYPVIANATSGVCTTGSLSCREFMVAPSNGLAPHGPFTPVGHDKVVASGHPAAAAGGFRAIF